MKKRCDGHANMFGNIDDTHALFAVSFDDGNRAIQHVASGGV
jgi:hypothetical protein